MMRLLVVNGCASTINHHTANHAMWWSKTKVTVVIVVVVVVVVCRIFTAK